MRSHTVSAEGGAAGVIAADDSIDEHIYDTISGSDWLGDQDAIEAFVHEAPRELLQLEHWGCPWSRQPDGHVAVRAVRRHEEEAHLVRRGQDRLPHAARALPDLAEVRRGRPVRRVVRDPAARRRRPGARRGRARAQHRPGAGDHRQGRRPGHGGCGKVFPFTTNANINTGDGMALAYRAGAPLKDMEFVQYHPTGLPFTGILITEATRAEGAWLVNKDGYRYLQDYDLGTPTPTPELRSMELGPRDRLSQAFVHEEEKGRTIDSPYGAVVHLDLRHLGAEADRQPAAVRARAVPEVRAHRPRQRPDPGPAGRPLHDGRRPHRHRRRDPAGRAVRRGRDRLRQHQRRQPARLQLAARVPGLRRPRRDAPPPSTRASRRRHRRPRSPRRWRTRRAGSSRT